MTRLWVAIFLLSFSATSFAVGTTIVAALGIAAAYGATTAAVIAFAINMVVATVITKAFATNPSFDSGAGSISGSSPNPGNRQQVPPATDNKLPVVYGTAYVGGVITDLSMTTSYQDIYYVVPLCEVTNTNPGQTPDTITFGNIYYGGKKVVFEPDGHTVHILLDESTGLYDDLSDGGWLQIYLYSNGSNSPVNSGVSAITLMQDPNLSYQWDATKLMSNTAFAIIRITYSQKRNLTGIAQTRFEITNSRTSAGDCFADYLINTRYGCAIPASQINYTSLTELNTYCNGSFSYTNSSGVTASQPRFTFNGTINTARTVMQNLQDMASSCDCLIKYNEVTAKWGVIVQKPTYTTVMDINDSNMISAIQITPLDIAASYNIVECKFPDNTNQDAFNSSTFDLAQIDPALLYPNEPVNKVSVSLPLVNNNVQAQYIATRLLKSGREDIQMQVTIGFDGIQLDAGDIVSVTSANYGWTAKPFRITKVVQQFNDDGSIGVQLNMSEYNPSVYDDAAITEFQPSPNTGIADPTIFSAIPTPVVSALYPTAANPFFTISVTTPTSGITQYAEIWYSAFSNPAATQMYFAGTSEIKSNGAVWGAGIVLPPITLTNIPAGNWYFFANMVNSVGSSSYSLASTLLQWRPSTFQYTERYLVVAYGTSITGAGFSLNPRGKTYYGLLNQDTTTPSTNPSDYTWYSAQPNFGTAVYLAYSNRTGRKFSFGTGFAVYAAGTGAFVPSQALIYDPSIWAALPDGTNYIDLDVRTGQLIGTGTTTTGTGEIAVTNNPDGKIVASLQKFLDFGSGVYSKTSAVANLTIDIYGRVVGFEAPDEFFYTDQDFTATAGQTVFTVTRGAGYISGQCLVFQNGCLLNPSEYTDTSGSTGTVTLSVGATAGDIISIVSMKSVNSTTGAYASFTRNSATLTNASSYTASGFTLNSGYELLFVNGTILCDQDYDITDQTINSFPSLMTGELEIIQWTPDNLGVPNGNPVNVSINTVIGQTIYPFSYNPLSFNLYSNGVALKQGTDFTTGSGSYTLANTPDTITTIMVQQTFARTGAV